jgi:CO/xanthine dehydrogenase FAD-binding subunit
MATLGGRLNAVDGRSTLITNLIAMDVISLWDEEKREVSLGEWLTMPEKKPGTLLMGIKYRNTVESSLEVVNKTKLDLPLLCVSASRWKSGRTRVAIGGFGKVPYMIFDGPSSDGAEKAAESACSNSEDAFASKMYRQNMAIVLTRRCLEKIEEHKS